VRPLGRWRLGALLNRARMVTQQLNTGVVRATDPLGDHRVLVSRFGAIEEAYQDCVGIAFRDGTMAPGEWRFGHYSPARARLIAHLILERVEELERVNGVEPVDEVIAAE
jgi:hypothetical protein